MEIDGHATVDFHQPALHRCTLYILSVLDLLRWWIDDYDIFLWLCMNASSNPIDQLFGDARVVAEVEAAEGLGLSQECGEKLYCGLDQTSSFKVDVNEMQIVLNKVSEARDHLFIKRA